MKICQAVLKLWSGHETCEHTKGNNSKNRNTRVTVHLFCTSSYDVNVCVKFHENMSSGFKFMERTLKLLTDRHTHIHTQSNYENIVPPDILRMTGV